MLSHEGREFARGKRIAGISVQGGHEHRGWNGLILADERWPLNKLVHEGHLIILDLLLPLTLSHNYAQPNLLSVAQKLCVPHDRHGQLVGTTKGRVAGGVTEGRF